MSAHEIECPKYEPIPGSRRCRHYLDNGACARPDELMCVEWLKRNGHPVPPRATSDATPRAQEPAATESVRALAVSPLSDEALESFRALGLEVCLLTAESRSVWIVPEYTGGDRLELRVDHAATLAVLCAAVPGARVTEIRRSSIAEDRQ